MLRGQESNLIVWLMRPDGLPNLPAILWNWTTLSSSGDTPSILYRVTYWIRTNVKGFADLCLTNSANLTFCSSIRTRTQTSSSVVKGAIHYTIEPTLARVVGFEPTSKLLESRMLPLHHTHVYFKLVVRDSNLPPSRYQRDALTKWANYQFCRISRIRTCVLHIPNVAR